MGALAATLIAGSDEQPPPPATQLAAGELPEALKNLVAEYLDEEGYRPAEPAPPPPPAPAELPPAPAPAVPVPVPVAPVSTRTGAEVWPVEIVPEPIAPPVRVPQPVIQAVAPVLPQPEAEPVAVAVAAQPEAEPATAAVAAQPEAEPATAAVATQPEAEPVADAQPEPVMAEEPVAFETRESSVAPEEDTAPIIRHAEAAPEPTVWAPTTADAIVVPAEPEVEGGTE